MTTTLSEDDRLQVTCTEPRPLWEILMIVGGVGAGGGREGGREGGRNIINFHTPHTHTQSVYLQYKRIHTCVCAYISNLVTFHKYLCSSNGRFVIGDLTCIQSLFRGRQCVCVSG